MGTHQGWLLAGHKTLLMDDELDEALGDNKHTRTLIWDVQDLQNPINTGEFFSVATSIDHNMYIVDGLAFQSNYAAGLRILDVSRAEESPPVLTEVGYFDVAPNYNDATFNGAWSVYPFFGDGVVVLQSIERG